MGSCAVLLPLKPLQKFDCLTKNVSLFSWVQESDSWTVFRSKEEVFWDVFTRLEFIENLTPTVSTLIRFFNEKMSFCFFIETMSCLFFYLFFNLNASACVLRKSTKQHM